MCRISERPQPQPLCFPRHYSSLTHDFPATTEFRFSSNLKEHLEACLLQILLGNGKAKVPVSNVHLRMDKRPKAEFCQMEGKEREEDYEFGEPEGETES